MSAIRIGAEINLKCPYLFKKIDKSGERLYWCNLLDGPALILRCPRDHQECLRYKERIENEKERR